ncbi:hypothetical protein OG320_05200 [Microbispora sp. NBC_01189]|uniref:hypothetical protein n=1 Tax=Microbispora sp. NBC_01189 TaxID=2903583 RepID=UPI002E13E03F|nr:hypothetical protein OG320_05200 [Microbispora sp. NBC_01189]
MATLTTQVIPLTGLAIAFTNAAGGGDQCATGDGVALLVRNNDASATTVTLVTPEQIDGDLAVADRAVSVAAGATAAIPMTSRYLDPATGLASITYSKVTSLQVACIRR